MNKYKISMNLPVLVMASLLLLTCVLPAKVDAENLDDTEIPGVEEVFAPEDLISAEKSEFDLEGCSYYEQARSMLELVNNLRAEQGVAPLVLNLQLEDLALVRAAESSVYWDHRRPDGSYLYDTNASVNGENIAGGLATVESVFDNWLKSPGHYANMVNPQYKSIGIAAYGSVHGEAPRWWAQVFSASLEGSKMPERENGAKVVQRINLVPSLLNLQIKSATEIYAGLSSQDFGQEHKLRLRLGDKLPLYGLVHYQIPDDYSQPGSVPAEDLIWEAEDNDVLSLSEQGQVEAVHYGSAEIRVAHRLYPELQASLLVEVLPVNVFRVKAELNAEASQSAWEQCQSLYVAKPSVTEYVGESTSSANKEKEIKYRYYEELQADSELYRIAWPLLKNFSIFLFPDSMESLPQINDLTNALPLGSRIAWHAFSDLDAPEDQKINVPGWAHSAATLVLNSAGHQVTFIIYSDAPGDGEIPELSSLIPEEERSEESPYAARYEVPVFADRNEMVLSFVNQGLAVQQLDFVNENNPLLSRNEQGQLVYQPQVFIFPTAAPFMPPVEPSSDLILYEVDQAELASFNEDGALVLKQTGSFTLHADVVDPRNFEVIVSVDIPVNNYLAVSSPENPDVGTVPAPSVSQVEDEED